MVENLSKTIKFGILGCGVIASTHAKVIEAIADAELLGVADASIENAEKFAKEHNVHSYSSYSEMLSSKEIDVVCVCTPSYFHEQNAIDAIDAGKHVILEKPMALTTDACDRIIEKCKESGKLLTVISQMRFADDVKRTKRLIEENAFGKISMCSLEMNYYRDAQYYANSNWRGTLKYDGGGALINQGIHGIDLIRYLLGNVVQVRAIKKTVSHKIEAEDSLAAVVEFECGAIGTVEASTCAYPGFDRKIKIYGDRGYVVLTEDNVTELMVDGEKKEINPTSSNMATANSNAVKNITYHKAQFENFISAINGNADISVDCHAGKNAVDIVERIYRSAKEN